MFTCTVYNICWWYVLQTFSQFTKQVDRGPIKWLLYSVTDNLRPNLGCYRGHSYPERSPDAPHVHTPWLDSLAGDSALFERAYVQWPYCGPSRAAILTGRRVYHLKTFICIVPLKVPMVVHRRPDSTLQHSNRRADSFCLKPGASFATSRRRVIDLPLFFRENGFYTAGFGKVRLSFLHISECFQEDLLLSTDVSPARFLHGELPQIHQRLVNILTIIHDQGIPVNISAS